MVNVTEWDRGDTVRINNSFTNIDDAAYDPDTVTLKIRDPTGAVTTVTYVGAQIIRSDTGVYYYDYNIATDAVLGKYIIKWIAVTSGFTDVSRDQFTVCETDEKLYCTVEEVWNRAGIDSNVAERDEVIPLIKDSMAEIDSMMGKTFSYATPITEWFNTSRDDCNVKVKFIKLNYTPIIEITSVKEYNKNKELVKTIDENDYYVNMANGTLTLLDTYFTKQDHRVEVIYTYGAIQVPRKIGSLCGVLSAMRLLVHQIGGTYDDVTTYSTCGLSVGVGEPYMNMSRNVEFLNKEATRLIANIGRLKPSCFIL